ncbi:MAG: hypothetical protein BGO01_06290 [Armatimonadetes bacterium 55-13]|nr:HTTM domain-containing protein [Armatimonadota bacterium]OJU65091.1 MAG: hypothetical protein BGO01_06290 [Armatimonadetes bacterium 55-13]
MSQEPQKGLRAAIGHLDRYWFGKGSPTAMGVIRILVGGLAFANFLMLLTDFDAWFTERGYVPQALAVRKMPLMPSTISVFGHDFSVLNPVPRISLLDGVTDTRITALVFGITILAAFFTMLGLWTRISTILLAIGIVSIHHRNGFIIHGGDGVLRVMSIYLAMAPCGLACSLDRVIGLWKGKIKGPPLNVSLWPQRLMAYNVALVYFTTFWHKMGGSLWRNGTATWYPARLHEFDRFPVPPFLNDVPMIYLTTYGTLAVELALGTLVFYRPLRKWVLLCGLLMHGFIEYSMNIPLFSFLMCSTYIAFYEGEEVNRWAKRLGERLRRYRCKVFSPARTPLRPGPAAALESLDPFGLVEYSMGKTDGWEAKDHDDKPISAVRASWTRSLGAWPLAWIPGLWARVLNKATSSAENAKDARRKPEVAAS